MTPRVVLALVDIAHAESALALLRYVKANCAGAEVHVAYVMPYGFYNYVEPYVSKESQKAAADRARAELAGLIERAELTGAVQHVLRGGVGEQSMLEAKRLKADLIVLNAARKESRHTTLGAQAAQIARHAECAVLLLR